MPLHPIRPRHHSGTAHRRHGPRRQAAVFALPNGLTIANLFCGIFAIVLATRQEYSLAGTYIVLGGIADALDGRVARATNSGTRLGAELDSLVDAISFGFAPAMIMFFAVLNHENWSWLIVFFYTTCACIRLARFNVEQAGRAKRYFHGLPSPAAGLTLATYYWFSQTPLYNETMLVNVPWHVALPALMAILSVLMISNVSYPAVPTVGYKTVREIVGSLVVLATILGLFFLPKEFFFPACIAYVAYGVLKTGLLGLLGMRDTALLEEVAEAAREPQEPEEVTLLGTSHASSPGDTERNGPRETGSTPMVSVASAPRLTVSADSPMPQAPQRRRRRRRPPRGNHPDRPDKSDDTTPNSPNSPPTPSGE